jgi:hypothetical protein
MRLVLEFCIGFSEYFHWDGGSNFDVSLGKHGDFTYSQFRRQIPVYLPCDGEICDSRHSGAVFPHSRRDTDNPAALLVFPAVFPPTNFSTRRRSPCFPPNTTAAIFSPSPTLMKTVI